MSIYTLRQISASVWTIATGRTKAGFVHKCPAGYIARIGKACVTARTAQRAFEEVVAHTLGFASAEAMAMRNSEIRASNAAKRRKAHAAADAVRQRGDFAPLIELIQGLEPRRRTKQ